MGFCTPLGSGRTHSEGAHCNEVVSSSQRTKFCVRCLSHPSACAFNNVFGAFLHRLPWEVVAHANFYGITRRSHLFRHCSILEGIIFSGVLAIPWWEKFLVAAGDFLGAVSPVTVILDALEGANKHLFIAVDEMDELYRQHPTTTFLSTLGELQELGNSLSGRVVVLLFGSSAMLPNLSSRNCTAFDEFPLLRSSPNLNGTKFSPVPLFSPTPTSLDIVSLFPRLSAPQCRVVLFFTGANIREIQKAGRASARMPYQSPYSSSSGMPYQSPYSSSSGSSKSVGDNGYRHLLVALLDEFYNVNKQLLAESFDVHGDWETKFSGLFFCAVEKLWKDLQGDGKINREEKENLWSYLMHLSDRGWIVVTQDRVVYPASLYMVFQRHDEKTNTVHTKSGFLKVLMTVLSAAESAATLSALA